MVGERDGGVVGRLQEEGVEQVLHADLLPHLQAEGEIPCRSASEITASGATVTTSVGWLCSRTSSAVMIFVRLAIGRRTSAAFENST